MRPNYSISETLEQERFNAFRPERYSLFPAKKSFELAHIFYSRVLKAGSQEQKVTYENFALKISQSILKMP